MTEKKFHSSSDLMMMIVCFRSVTSACQAGLRLLVAVVTAKLLDITYIIYIAESDERGILVHGG